jgi:hypothetical protein
MVNVINGALDFCRVIYQGYENAPQSRNFPPGVSEEFSDLERSIYQVVKTNLAFLDALYVGAKWMSKDYWSHFTFAVIGMRSLHLLVGLWRVGFFLGWKSKSLYLGDSINEKELIGRDVLINGLNIAGCALTFKEYHPMGTFFPLAVDTLFRGWLFYIKKKPFDRPFIEYHDKPGMDVLKTIGYVAHFAIASLATYVMYQHGQKLLEVALTLELDQGRNSQIVSIACGVIGLAAYWIGQGIGQKINRDELSKIVLGIGSFTVLGSIFLQITKGKGYVRSLSVFPPLLMIGGLGLVIGYLTNLTMSRVNDIAEVKDSFRRVLQWTCAVVVSAVATASITTHYQYVPSQQKFWLLAMQTGIIASGAFMLLCATYIAFHRLVFYVPPSGGVEPAWSNFSKSFGEKLNYLGLNR